MRSPRRLRDELDAFQALVLRSRPSRSPGLVPGDEALERRLHVYRYGFEARTRAALESAFPRTRERMGDRAWRRHGRAYVFDGKPPAKNLNLLGRGFPRFLRARAAPAPLVELAMLEWAMLEASLLPLQPPLASVAGLRPDLPLAFQPSYVMLRTEWRVAALLERPGARAGRSVEGATVVFRSASGIHVREARRSERALQLQSRRGRSLTEAVEHLALSAGELTLLLTGWTREGLLVQQLQAGPRRSTA